MNKHLLHFFTMMLFLLTNVTSLTTQQQSLEITNAFIGCWQDNSDEDILIRFEPTKCIYSYHGMKLVTKVRYEPGKIIHMSKNDSDVWNVSVESGKLSIFWAKKTQIFNKLDFVPSELDLDPFKLGKPAKLSSDRIISIEEELKRRGELDQAVRIGDAITDEMVKVDRDNTAYLKKLVADVGWIDARRFSKEASSAAFFIVQHSGDIPLMRVALPEIEKDVKAKRLGSQPYALLYDRLKTNLGEKQRYGTQINRNEQGEWFVEPLENRQRVDEYRKELGLPPLSEYLEIIKKAYGVEEIKFFPDDKQINNENQ